MLCTIWRRRGSLVASKRRSTSVVMSSSVFFRGVLAVMVMVYLTVEC